MDLLGSLGASGMGRESGDVEEVLVCSRKGCTEVALWKLLWNNPNIHTPLRRKVWLACDEHREFLESFLSSRGFWKATEEISSAE